MNSNSNILSSDYFGIVIAVRPSIVLKKDSMYSKVDGSFGNPYVLVTK